MRFNQLFCAAATAAMLAVLAGTQAQAQTQPAMSPYPTGPTELAPSNYSAPVIAPHGSPCGCGSVAVRQPNVGCAACSQAPIVNMPQDYSPVQACCTPLGRLGIPSLPTPARSYRPPMGRANGRPLFGKWQGF